MNTLTYQQFLIVYLRFVIVSPKHRQHAIHRRDALQWTILPRGSECPTSGEFRTSIILRWLTSWQINRLTDHHLDRLKVSLISLKARFASYSSSTVRRMPSRFTFSIVIIKSRKTKPSSRFMGQRTWWTKRGGQGTSNWWATKSFLRPGWVATFCPMEFPVMPISYAYLPHQKLPSISFFSS